MQKEKFLEALVEEDLGRGDLFSRVSVQKQISAYVIAKSDGVLSGKEYVDVLIGMYGLSCEWAFNDGDRFLRDDKILWVFGDNKTLVPPSKSSPFRILLVGTGYTLKPKSSVPKYSVKVLF